MSLLDPKLELLDHLRMEYKVHIHWDDKIQCLVINAESRRNAEQNLIAVIKGIRKACRGAKAHIMLATPIYNVVPPTAESMRSIVRPKTVERQSEKFSKVVTSIELAGELFSEEDKQKWATKYPEMIENGYEILRQHLLARVSLSSLANLQGWMRMRIHLGHVNLREYQVDFGDSKFSFEDFAGMMKRSRVTSSGKFDRK
jgi:hypothetical protein